MLSYDAERTFDELKQLEENLRAARRSIKWNYRDGTPYRPEAVEAADQLRHIGARLMTLSIWIKQDQAKIAELHRAGIGEQ
ncbi:hypothetical protein THIAE_05760 [Thiomicrospira aerophila AL3]|uniref:Uncharacterized protein n=1 Tax=Thiomicrospira aerophila AL3 TaxID=717772 RepID=W0DZ49_9GAMM|nr:hypothetical protein [Thiomicrospira aerophila]AHF02254.1 hypothetical protein THIAE_05760 [Thiomicrospira aerophila AL3]